MTPSRLYLTVPPRLRADEIDKEKERNARGGRKEGERERERETLWIIQSSCVLFLG